MAAGVRGRKESHSSQNQPSCAGLQEEGLQVRSTTHSSVTHLTSKANFKLIYFMQESKLRGHILTYL